MNKLGFLKNLLGDYSKEETPVPIPNTAVKLFSADGTSGATLWESRTLPSRFFYCQNSYFSDIVIIMSNFFFGSLKETIDNWINRAARSFDSKVDAVVDFDYSKFKNSFSSRASTIASGVQQDINVLERNYQPVKSVAKTFWQRNHRWIERVSGFMAVLLFCVWFFYVNKSETVAVKTGIFEVVREVVLNSDGSVTDFFRRNGRLVARRKAMSNFEFLKNQPEEDGILGGWAWMSAGVSMKMSKGIPDSVRRWNSMVIWKILNEKGAVPDGIVYEFFSNGAWKFAWRYENDDLNGISKGYLDNGNLLFEDTYKNGLLNGVSITYFDNGNVRFEKNYRMGWLDGIARYYSSSGVLVSEAVYKNGALVGKRKSVVHEPRSDD